MEGDAFILAGPSVSFAGLRNADTRDGRAKVTAEGLFVAGMVAALVGAPSLVSGEQSIDVDGQPRSDTAALAQECADGRSEVFKFLHGFDGGVGLLEAPALLEAFPTLDGPIQDAGSSGSRRPSSPWSSRP
jgi:hypothetical protein